MKKVYSNYRITSLLAVTLLMLWLSGINASAQTVTYPVQVYTQLIPPYTPYTPSYYSGGVEKMRVTLINSDMMQPVLEVYLKMKITSSTFSIQTPEAIRMPSITLQAGVPFILSHSDLEPYFRRENLSVTGGQSEFYHTLMFPDNFYRFHFEVYEVNTGRLLSNARVGFVQAMIAAGDPPVLNLPQKSSVIQESNIPSIMFTWTPRHLNSVASAYGTEYEFSLVEIYDKQTSAENAFQYSRALFNERTRATAFTYTAAQPLLQPGMRYGWRIRAVAREGVEDAQVFKNNGYSEIFWFDYKGNCPAVTSSGVVVKGLEAEVSWQPTQAIDYTIEYRKKGGSKWYAGNVSGTSSTLYGLQWGETYEYRIGSRCYPNDVLDYSAVKAFTMPDLPERNPNCGIMADANLSNRTPVTQLTPGMPVFAGDFPIFITEVRGNGVFSGTGYVGIPFTKLPRITVIFNNITVNTDHRLISGFFETKYDINNKNLLWDLDEIVTGGGGVGDIRTGDERAQFVVDYTINPNIKVKPVFSGDGQDNITDSDGNYIFTKNENGKYEFIITDSKGNEHRIESDTMPVTIEDKEGNTYLIDEKGNITPISSDSGIRLDPATRYKVATDVVSVEFAEIEGVTKYTVDRYIDVYQKVTEYYQQYKAGDREIAASAKFMLPGTSDKFVVKIKESKPEFDPAKVRFVTSAGKEYEAAYMSGSKQWEITVIASDANDGQELFVVYETEPGKYATVALINIYSYESLSRSVTLVPVNGQMNGLNRQSVENELNRIYGKIGIQWKVNVLESSFNYTPINGSTFNVTGSGLFSTLTNDMKAINEAFKQSGNYQEDGLYLFILPFEASDKGEIAGTGGDMPLGSQFGYLFLNAGDRTIAHEVGHGAFNLEHPFDRPLRNSFEKGALTDNLMDYTSGTEFAKLQWDQTRKPGLAIGLFQTDESGQLAIWGGITWLGNIFWGLAPDSQEKEIENIRSFLDHVYDNHQDYFEKSKTADINITKTEHKDWSVRKSSHSGKITESIYKKFNAKQDTIFNLWNKGIYLEDYKLENKTYQVSVYSAQATVNLKNEKIRLKGYKNLANNTYIKAGYTKKYGIIALYGEDKKFQMLLQISGQDKPEKIAQQWLNYLAIVVASEEQRESDVSIWDKIQDKFVSQLRTIKELLGVWGEKVVEEGEIFLENIQWVSQMDESIFGLCTGCWKSSCCRRAAEYMMGNTGIANCSDSVIAKNAPYMVVSDRINTASFSNNTNKYNRETYNAATLNYDAAAMTEAIDHIKNKLKIGRPVLIGIHYTNGGTPPNNQNRATRHFMVIVGYKKEANGQESFRYYDPGRTYEIDGASLNNKLIINKENNNISGTYKNTETCTLTEVIKTN